MPGAETARSRAAEPLGAVATGLTAEAAVSADVVDESERDAVLSRETAKQALQLSMNRRW
ncbi:MAG TPA: hypothetical protein VLF40_05175 [Candidatus Saccharimonadales bacterium]|nr:hypothetical protein [Candidatus Saccharimonadales bacterium]